MNLLTRGHDAHEAKPTPECGSLDAQDDPLQKSWPVSGGSLATSLPIWTDPQGIKQTLGLTESQNHQARRLCIGGGGSLAFGLLTFSPEDRKPHGLFQGPLSSILRTPGSQQPLPTAPVSDARDMQRLREGKQVAEVTQHLHWGPALLASLPSELSPPRPEIRMDHETHRCQRGVGWGVAEALRSQAGWSGEGLGGLPFWKGQAD